METGTALSGVRLRGTRRSRVRSVAVLAVLGLLTGSCGGAGGGGGDGQAQGAREDFEGRPPDEGQPRRGGRVVYALEAETGGGWCLPTARLAAGGIQVASAVYDTLTVPADDGKGGVKYVPYLAESVEHNDDYTEWTIKIREGVKFHDGTNLTAEVVKQNLDAYQNGELFLFLFADDVARTEVVDPLTVKVTTNVPWVAYDAFLWYTGRVGMVAPAQLADRGTCPRNLIGTGPFRFVEWTDNDRLVVERNPDYWREDEHGQKLPYLDAIEFRPVPDVGQRMNGLKGGDYDLIHTSDGQQITQLRDDAEAGAINLIESDFAGEVSYTMLNASKPPFDNKTARLAVAHAVNVEELIDITEDGVVRRAVQPFTEDNIAYVDPEKLSFPEYDLDRAKELVRQYEQETGRDLAFTLLSTTDSAIVEQAQLSQSQAEEAGMQVELDQVEQTQIINTALGGQFDAVLWRNHPGGDPDTQLVWWTSTNTAGARNLVNFGRINDPELDRLLRQGRSETDPEQRKEVYQGVSRRFAEEVYNLWGWYTLWAFASAPEVHGVYPAELPTGDEPLIIASAQPVVGLWLRE